MADSGGRSIGRDSSQGPGWWLASDGKWYPPELAPAARPAKAKKKRKKKAPAKKPAAAGSTTASTSKAPKAAPRPTGSSATTDDADEVDQVESPETSEATNPTASDNGHGHGTGSAGDQPDVEIVLDDESALAPSTFEFDDEAPPTDQIVARRIQAREQNVLLAGARQQAALRALSNLGVEPEPELVSVGARSFDARSTEPRPAGPTIDPPAPATAAPEADDPAAAAGDTADDRPDGRSSTSTEATSTEVPSPTPTASAAEVEPTPPVTRDEVPAPHQPTKRPEPASVPMGTDAPFMEVRGSALGTDIERIGEKILIFADRVELRDRGNTTRQTIAYDELAKVEIQKKIMGPTLLIESVTGETMTAKALRPELATGAKAMIEKHARRHLDGLGPSGEQPAMAMAHTAPPPPTSTAPEAPAPAPAAAPAPAPAPASPAPSGRLPHKHVLVAMIEELHAAGVLTADERRAKLELLDTIVRD